MLKTKVKFLQNFLLCNYDFIINPKFMSGHIKLVIKNVVISQRFIICEDDLIVLCWYAFPSQLISPGPD